MTPVTQSNYPEIMKKSQGSKKPGTDRTPGNIERKKSWWKPRIGFSGLSTKKKMTNGVANAQVTFT